MSSPGKIRRRLWLRLLVVGGGLCLGCEPLGQSYGCGYDLGYNAADWVLGESEKRAASEAAWEEACAAHAPVPAAEQIAGDDACDDQGFGSRLRACDDPGAEHEVLPAGCDPFGASIDAAFSCPAGVSGRCLCCANGPEACGLGGDFCDSDDRCCGGACALPVEVVDGGPPRGTCL